MVPSTSQPAGRSRSRGQATRRAIVEATVRLTAAAPGQEVSVARIAAEAGVYPNQITYYFGSKDALVVEAAFVAVLRDARRLERVGDAARTPEAFRRAIARVGLAMPSTRQLVQALALASRSDDLDRLITRQTGLLFRQTERYVEGLARRRGWTTRHGVEIEVRHFWTVVLGAGLITGAGFPGTAADIDLSGILTMTAGDPPG